MEGDEKRERPPVCRPAPPNKARLGGRLAILERNGPEVDVVGVASYEGAVPTPLANAFRCLSAHAHSRLSQLLARAAYSVIMASPNLRIMGFGNPLLDISAVVEQETLDKCVSHSTPCPLS